MLSVKCVSRWAPGPFPALCKARAHRIADLQAVLVVRIVGVQLASNAATRPFMAFEKNAVSTLLRMRSSLSIVLDAGLRDKRSRPQLNQCQRCADIRNGPALSYPGLSFCSHCLEPQNVKASNNAVTFCKKRISLRFSKTNVTQWDACRVRSVFDFCDGS